MHLEGLQRLLRVPPGAVSIPHDRSSVLTLPDLAAVVVAAVVGAAVVGAAVVGAALVGATVVGAAVGPSCSSSPPLCVELFVWY